MLGGPGHGPAVGLQSRCSRFHSEALLACCDSRNGSHFWSCRTKLPSISSSVAVCLVAMLSRGGCNAGINKVRHARELHIPGAIT